MTSTESTARTAWINWLATLPISYHLTLTFPPNTNHGSTKKLLDLLLTHLNRRIFRRRYSEGKSFLQGIAVREEKREQNTDHYHIMIIDEDNHLPEYDRFHSLIDKEVGRLRGPQKRNFIKSFKLQDYFNNNGTDGLETYLTKNFYDPAYTLQRAIDSMGAMTQAKVVFGADYFQIQ